MVNLIYFLPTIYSRPREGGSMKKKKRPSSLERKVKTGISAKIDSKLLSKLAKESAFLQHKARLADFHYKQKLVREFRKNYEEYIG